MSNLPYHDFPVSQYLLGVFGYMILGNSSNSTNEINENLKYSSIHDRAISSEVHKSEVEF